MTEPVQYHEDTDSNIFVIRVKRADGSQFLTNVMTCTTDDQGQIVLTRRFFTAPPLTPATLNPYHPKNRRPHHDCVRVVAKGAWVEWEDVTDRIRPVEAEEIENDGRTDQEPDELARPVQGVRE